MSPRHIFINQMSTSDEERPKRNKKKSSTIFMEGAARTRTWVLGIRIPSDNRYTIVPLITRCARAHMNFSHIVADVDYEGTSTTWIEQQEAVPIPRGQNVVQQPSFLPSF